MSNGNNGTTLKFKPTEMKMLIILSDGQRHSRHELHKCLNDELAPMSNIRAHLTSIRKQLRPRGEDIICEIWQAGIHYRHVRLLASAYDGKR